MPPDNGKENGVRKTEQRKQGKESAVKKIQNTV
jgi:hypothetical protein